MALHRGAEALLPTWTLWKWLQRWEKQTDFPSMWFVYNLSIAYFFAIQSVHQALAVCVAAWVAVRGRGLVWAMESVSVTPDTPAICARTAPTATSERSALMKAWEPVQVVANPRPEENPVWSGEKLTRRFPVFHPWQHATTHAGGVRGQRTTNASTANPAGCFTTTSAWVSAAVHHPCPCCLSVSVWAWTFWVLFGRHRWVRNRAGSLSFQHLLSQHGWIVWMQRSAGLWIGWFYFDSKVPVYEFLCLCSGCDQACVGCMGSGPARCKKCARGYRLKGAKCLGEDTC